MKRLEKLANRQDRRGISLLFTISMLVLFLMLCTTFVIVSNNYYRSAIRRGKRDIRRKDTVQLLDHAFYDVLRGPSLDNPASPLRGLSILEDLYGYGIKGKLEAEARFQPSSNRALVVLTLDTSTFESVRTREPIRNLLRDETYVDGVFNGRVLSLTSGRAAGYSTRIVSHAAIDSDDDGQPDQLQIVIPRDEREIDWAEVGSSDEFVLNGREYSGFGAGEIADHDFDPDAEAELRLVPDTDEDENVDSKKATASRPNRIGEPFEKLVDSTGYLSNDKSPNEPHDAPDQHNMFLSGPFDDEGNGIPSFHRDQLYDYQFERSESSDNQLSVSDIRRFSFRPIHIEGAFDSTAQSPGKVGLKDNSTSWFGRYDSDGKLDSEVEINQQAGLDVDTDMDGFNDAVWIDIGLADQIDDQGYRYRPLVAYRIIDLDGRLNLNAHGLPGDTQSPPQPRFGTGYGVAEISFVDALGDDGDYEGMLELRYGEDKEPGAEENALTPEFFPTQKLIGHPRINTKTRFRFATGADFFASNALAQPEDDPERMPEYVEAVDVTNQNPYLSDFGLNGGVGDDHYRVNELEGFLRRGDVDASLVASRIQGLSDSAAKSLTTHSFELAIPAVPFSIQELLQKRLAETFSGTELKEIYNIFTSDRIEQQNRVAVEMKYISKDMLMGGRFNLIPLIGNGLDDDLDGVVDDIDELALGEEGSSIDGVSKPQYGRPDFDLNNDPETSDAGVKTLMAKQLYVLALLVCGDEAPEDYPSGPEDEDGISLSAGELYRQSIAQWAVNIVDFYDPDSIMTVFEFDLNPFNDPRIPENLVDGDPTTDEETERGIVYGAERPEILITETFAHHDRQSQDASSLPGFEVASNKQGEIKWVSGRVPQSSLYVELYHPHRQSLTSNYPNQGFQTLPFELSNLLPPENAQESLVTAVQGVDMGIVAPDDTPVWRIAVHRGSQATEADEHVRTIYFTDPVDSKAPDPGHDCFFPFTEPATVEPRNDRRCYLVLGTDGNVGRGEQTFGRLSKTSADQDPSIRDIALTRGIKLSSSGVAIRDWDGRQVRQVVSRPCIGSIVNFYRNGHSGNIQRRGLSLSDPDGGYSVSPSNIDRGKSRDGVTLKMPRETLFDDDGATGNRDAEDMEAIWTNGIKQDDDYQFRVLKLQRLANPEEDFHEVANPYITIDVANVDLVSFNGMQCNPLNEVEPDFDDSLGTRYTLVDAGTTLGGIERGEELAMADSPEAARRQLFRALGRIEASDQSSVMPSKANQGGDGHNLSYLFTDGDVFSPNDADRHETLGGRNASFDATNQYSWLAWNNRPFANAMELANVPALSPEGIVRHFNRSESETEAIGEEETADRAFSFFFGDDQFGHLLASGSVNREGELAPNRFDWLWEYVEVPSRFLGSEKYLAVRDNEGEPIFVPAGGALKFNLHPPMHTIPNFRYPGKINLNTINSAEVWNALVRGFGDLDFETFSEDRDQAKGGSDVGRYYTTAQAAEFTDDDEVLRKGADAGLFRAVEEDTEKKLTDSVNDDEYGAGTDVEASAAFRNELRTRLGIAATTRSNVYAVWITIGYFQVDELGRLGAEIGSVEDGQVKRNRAFYIVDRSIPVASEPGKNHNVDEAVLVRTIIE